MEFEPQEEQGSAAFPWEQAKAAAANVTNPQNFSWPQLPKPWPQILLPGIGVIVLSGIVLALSATAPTPPAPNVVTPPAETITTPSYRPVRSRNRGETSEPKPVQPTLPIVPVSPSPSAEELNNMKPANPYPALTKEDLKTVLKNVGRSSPFSAPETPQLSAPGPISPLPPPTNLPAPAPIPLEPAPVLAALAYSPTVGWLAQVQIGERVYDAYKGGRVGSWLVRSIGGTGVVLSKGKQTVTLPF